MTEANTTKDEAPPPKASLVDLVSSYSILSTLSSYISTLDLYHTALTSRALYSYIFARPETFRVLRRNCLCDGRGLVLRQSFAGPYRPDFGKPAGFLVSDAVDHSSDEEMEVRLYNVRCDATGALPCVRCDVNVCEECRSYPRAEPNGNGPSRFPHQSWYDDHGDIMFFCGECDAKTEDEGRGEFLNELCDCDLYTRWICTRCALEIDTFTTKYFLDCTSSQDEGRWDQSWKYPYPIKTRDEAEGCCDGYRAFWCPCGKEVPPETRARCTWCKRRHPPEDEWRRTWAKDVREIPFFDNNPDYPRWVIDESTNAYPDPYPRLGYWRPGDGVSTIRYRNLLRNPITINPFLID